MQQSGKPLIIETRCQQQLQPAPLLICERELFPATWQALLAQSTLQSDPPVLTVTSRPPMTTYGPKR